MAVSQMRNQLVDAAERDGIAVHVEDLWRSFGPRAVLRDLDLDIRAGEFVALLGRSGGGKTTLLRTLGGLDPVQKGVVVVPEERAIVFQEHRLLPWRSVWRNVAFGLGGTDPRGRAFAALGEVGLSDRADAWPLTLSGGEAQRTALARALVREPKLLLLDEPFGALDALTRIQMHDLVLQLWRRHRPAVLLVTHDVEEALLLAERVLILDEGQLSSVPIPEQQLPRRRTDPLFAEAREMLLARLGVTSATLTSATRPGDAGHDDGSPVDSPPSLGAMWPDVNVEEEAGRRFAGVASSFDVT
jgi:sulfonate transport system ATP-binding protein